MGRIEHRQIEGVRKAVRTEEWLPSGELMIKKTTRTEVWHDIKAIIDRWGTEFIDDDKLTQWELINLKDKIRDYIMKYL
jgi:hypothetical protein